jgi:putative endonuclease
MARPPASRAGRRDEDGPARRPTTPRAPGRPAPRCGALGRPALGRRALGRRGEQLARAHLLRRDYEILAGNVRTRAGEIDLIASTGRVLVFVEVKTLAARTPPAADRIRPLDWLHARQCRRLRLLAAAWLRDAPRRPPARSIRFDAIGVVVDSCGALLRLDHVESAW